MLLCYFSWCGGVDARKTLQVEPEESAWMPPHEAGFRRPLSQCTCQTKIEKVHGPVF